MSSANKRLEKIKHHLQPNDNPHFETRKSNKEKSTIKICLQKKKKCTTVRIHRKPGQVPYISKLDPLSFLLRSAMLYPHKTAIIHRQRSFTFMELCDRTKALANVLLEKYHVKTGDRIAILCQNINAYTEAQYAVPAIGAITVPINTRLAAKEIEYILEHSGASIVIVQQELLDHLTEKSKSSVTLIEVSDSDDPRLDPYETLLASSSNQVSWNDMPSVDDENETISINYTSGSTGKPKGVMVTYRGAYMMAMGMAIHDKLSLETVFLWTLPMFHCNGNVLINYYSGLGLTGHFNRMGISLGNSCSRWDPSHA